MFEEEESNSTFINPSFSSYANSMQTQGDDQIPFEVIFQNEALIKILGQKEKDKLQTYIDKPVFVNTEINTQMSIINAAMGRYSDSILSQIH